MRTISVRASFMATVFGLAGLFQVLHAPVSAAAPNPESCFTTTGTTTRTITDYNFAGVGCGATVEIPSTIGGGTVVSTGEDAFNSKGITSVSIPITVTSIGNSSFAFNQLTSVSIPNSVTTIGYGAFSNNSLVSVTLPSSLTTILDAAFANNDISSIVIPSSLTTISDYVFSANELTSVVIPSSVSVISNGAFNENKLASVTIPNSVTAIGNHAFHKNRLTNVTIPNSVTIIEQQAFSQNDLTTITLPSSVTDIGIYAFYANRLVSVQIPNTVTNIGDYAFGAQSSSGRTFDDTIYGLDASAAQSAIDSIWYVNLFTINPTNPQNILDSVGFGMTELDGQDNDYDEKFIIGGYIVNPTNAELQFVNSSNNRLLNPLLLTGQTQNGLTHFNNYLVKDGPDIQFPNNVYFPSVLEAQASRDALSQYYRVGSTLGYTAASINGTYPTPTSYSFVLGASTASNARQFVYAITASNAASQGAENLAYTGSHMWIILLGAGVVTIGSLGILLRR